MKKLNVIHESISGLNDQSFAIPAPARFRHDHWEPNFDPKNPVGICQSTLEVNR